MTDENWMNRLARAIGSAVERNQPDRGEPPAEVAIEMRFPEPEPEGIEGIRLRQARRDAFARLADSMRPAEAAMTRLGEAYRRINADLATTEALEERLSMPRVQRSPMGHVRVLNFPVQGYPTVEVFVAELRARHPLLWRDLEDRLGGLAPIQTGDMWALRALVSFTETDGIDLRELSTSVLRDRQQHGYELEVPFEFSREVDASHPDFLVELARQMPHPWLSACTRYPRAFNVNVDRDIRTLTWRVSIRTQVPVEAFRSPTRMAIEQEAAVQLGMSAGRGIGWPASAHERALEELRQREVFYGDVDRGPRREYQRYTGLEEPSTVSSQEEPFVPQSGPRKLKLRNPRGKQDVPHSEYQSNQNPVHRRIARRRARDEPERD